MENVKDVSCAGNISCVVTTNGTVYAWAATPYNEPAT